MLDTVLENIDTAFQWLCQSRQHFPANADIWYLRHHWVKERQRLIDQLKRQEFQFDALTVITTRDNETIHLCCARDALVRKALAITITPMLSISSACVHIKGHGGLKLTVERLSHCLKEYSHVCKTDVKGYYEHIDQSLLIQQLRNEIKDPYLLHLLIQSIQRSVESGGLWRDIKQGIARGCPLSPIYAALYLKALDEQLSQRNVFYARYMDDIVILTKTKGALRRAIRTLNEQFYRLKLTQAPDKTFIGRISKDFDFLGYHFIKDSNTNLSNITVSNKTIGNHLTKCHRLYEQLRHKKSASERRILQVRLDDYCRRWRRWSLAGFTHPPLPIKLQLKQISMTCNAAKHHNTN